MKLQVHFYHFSSIYVSKLHCFHPYILVHCVTIYSYLFIISSAHFHLRFRYFSLNEYVRRLL